jgi:hypothetical protein
MTQLTNTTKIVEIDVARMFKQGFLVIDKLEQGLGLAIYAQKSPTKVYLGNFQNYNGSFKTMMDRIQRENEDISDLYARIVARIPTSYNKNPAEGIVALVKNVEQGLMQNGFERQQFSTDYITKTKQIVVFCPDGIVKINDLEDKVPDSGF